MHNKVKQYKEITKFLSAYSILEHKDGATVIASQNHTYLVRNIQISNHCNKQQQNQQLNEIITILYQHQTLKSKNILSLVDFQIIFNKTKTQSQIRAVYQYGRKSLAKQIEDRKQSDEYFDQDALWGLIYSITSALAYLQQKSIIYGVIDASRTFLDNNIIAILDPSSTGIDPYQIVPNRVYSPQLLQEQRSLQDIDMFKSDVFSLGLLMLQCALLKMELYEYDENILKICLSEIKDLYSQGFAQLIEAMLDFQSDQRPSFAQILTNISSMFEVSNSECQTLQPMGPDQQNQPNQMCELDEYSEVENIDILETEYIRYEDYPNPALDEFEKAQLRFYHSRDEQLNESPINESSEISENGSLFIQESLVKSVQKSNRVYKPKQIKNKLVKNDFIHQSDLDRTQQVQTERLQETNFHRRSKTNWENDCQNNKSSKKNSHIKETKEKSQKQNSSHYHNFSSGTIFSPLNKENLFTKPEIMNMIKHDMKKIQDRKKTFLTVNFSYLSQDESKGQFMKNNQNHQNTDKSYLKVHQSKMNSNPK